MSCLSFECNFKFKVDRRLVWGSMRTLLETMKEEAKLGETHENFKNTACDFVQFNYIHYRLAATLL